jgi:RNA ligase (TIGR02306 family)
MSSLIIEVCKIEEVTKHPNADKLDIVRVKNWNCIVGLNQYKVGDLVVFCPPDSIIPPNLIDKYNLEYLRSNGKVGTTKLRGFISQGLVLDLPEGNYKEGDDLAAVLNITKYEVPESPAMPNQPKKSRLNPGFDKYTDIENIKNFKDVFKEGDFVVASEKVHGSNARFANLEITINRKLPFLFLVKNLFKKYILKQTHQFVYGSHNVQLEGRAKTNNFYGDDKWGQIAKKYDMANIIPKDYIVYGEIYGKGIQDLTYGLNDVDLVVFDVKYKDKYLDWDAFYEFCKELDLPIVPILYIGTWNEGVLDYTNGKSKICPSQIREGIVIKTVKEENNPKIGRKILKSVSPDYLTRKNGTEFK